MARSYTRTDAWSTEEWAKVLAVALPKIERGESKAQSLIAAQRRALPKARHRTESALVKCAKPSDGAFDRAVAIYKSNAPAPAPKEAKPKAAPGGVKNGPRVRWTEHEWCVLAALVEWAIKTGDFLGGKTIRARSLRRLYEVAQVSLLPSERRRDRTSIGTKSSMSLEDRHKEALARAWAYPDAAALLENGLRGPQSDAPPTTPQADADRATTVALTPAPAPSSLTVEAKTPDVAAFAALLVGGLESLLAARDAALLQRYTEAVESMMAPKLAAVLADVQSAVRATLMQELGVAPSPAPEPAPEKPPAPSWGVDVVGLIDAEWRKRLRDAAGDAADLRIFAPTSAHELRPEPGRPVIWMQHGRLNRELQKRLDAIKMRPTVVRNAAGQVLKAIEDLVRSRSAHTLQ